MLVEADIENAPAKRKIDRELPVLLWRPEWELLSRHGSCEVALGQVWTFVRQRRLRTDQHDLAAKASVAESCGDRVSCRPAADDYCFGRSSSRSRRRDQNRYPPSTATANA